MKEEAKNCLGHLGILVGLTGTLMPPTEGCHPLPVHAPLPREERPKEQGNSVTTRKRSPEKGPYLQTDLWSNPMAYWTCGLESKFLGFLCQCPDMHREGTICPVLDSVRIK
jgi:hypothetical protein